MKLSSELEAFVQSHLNLQVKISYPDHHGFLLRHKLGDCAQVLDVGTGNGTFVARLAEDHPNIHFVGIDKRRHCIDSCKTTKNFEAFQVDMFSRTSTFDFSQFDGFLMRYFLLHVDNAQKILELFKAKAKRPSRFWVIDLDWSQFTCEPKSETFDKLTGLVKDFCSKISVESRGGQNALPLLQKLGFQNIQVEHIPFSSKNIPIEELALYIKQEVLCYSIMSGRAMNDPETTELVQFIDKDVRAGKFKISYGMILLTAELTP
ncbi:methyltransferase domain-containing protein [Peredibacter starrii]|uniref:Methyltransferase domain-containing protein n=1 Tax=Peredibacter starrii TaxID=28202 RepID=A0AAX4HTL1_9BACT|nr:methyltransferase domain-containing protein [Peredibacter starrii]WPU66547.1 methyltransferase domain-containing protein [Peredibacter starrii]